MHIIGINSNLKLVEIIERGAFNESGLQSIDLSENVGNIGREALANCRSLERVTIRSSSLFHIGDEVFTSCGSLSSIYLYPWLWHKNFRIDEK